MPSRRQEVRSKLQYRGGFRRYALREKGVVEIESEWTARDRELKMSGSPARIFLCPEPALSLSKG